VVAAQAIATNILYSDSSRVDQNYDFIPGSLIPPVISPDRPALGRLRRSSHQRDSRRAESLLDLTDAV